MHDFPLSSPAHTASGNGEYAALEMVALADLPGFLARVADHLTPQAPVFLTRMGALPGGWAVECC